MKSVSLFQYPHIVFEKGIKKLWNPIQRKRLANRPEERVRLQIIEYLTRDAGWSSHRITTEIPVSLATSDTPNRADILCYDEEFTPRLLIECKAESIRISDKTGEQIGRYNTRIRAPYLMVSNGRTDFFFKVENGNVLRLSEKPDLFNFHENLNSAMQHRDFVYWSSRGFAGSEASPELRKWLHDCLPALWSNSSSASDLSDPVYLQIDPFPNSDGIRAFDQYFRVFNYKKRLRFAFTFLSTPHGGTRIIIIRNEAGNNTGLIVINPELVLAGQTPNTFLFNHLGEQPLDLQSHLPKDHFFSETDNHWINRLADLMLVLY